MVMGIVFFFVVVVVDEVRSSNGEEPQGEEGCRDGEEA
jgi:hypothetical protein